jgi:hypothetical protein
MEYQMHNKSFLPSLGTALLMGCIVACSDSTSPNGTSAFNTEITNDLAPTAGADIAAAANFYGGASNSSVTGSFANNVPASSSGGLSSRAALNPPTGTTANWIAPNCVFRPLRGFFECPRIIRNGHIDSVSYQLFQTGNTTDSIHFALFDTSAISFTRNSKTFSDTGGLHIDATVILADSLHTWNGTGSGTMHSVRVGDITQIYQLAASDTTSGLQFYVPRSRHPYPIAGTIIRNYMVTRIREGSDTTHRTVTRRVVVTFNGTNAPTMTINGTNTFTVNLDTEDVTSR